TLDLYRDIHKAIRSELFAVTLVAGHADPADAVARRALAAHVGDVMDLLVQHAHHEDGAIGPVLQRELPDLAEAIEHDHDALEGRIDDLRSLAAGAVEARDADRRPTLHRLYVELASFTSAYLA